MRKVLLMVALVVMAAGPLACAGGGASRSVPSSMSLGDARQAVPMLAGFRSACPGVALAGQARCSAFIARIGGDAPSGYGPADLQSAYNLPSKRRGSGQVVAVVDAYDDPNAESDLAVYRSTFNLPPCTSSSGCFVKVNQDGQEGPYPQPNAGWAVEISGDVDMISAGCPRCTILLVEANSSAFQDLGAAVDEAVKLGAHVVGNSYSGAFPQRARKYFEHPGVIFVASAADNGFGPQEPAAFPSVVAVGGTTLRRDQSKRGWSETAWGSGGCTTFLKPTWQHDTFCTTRTTNDVAAVADPSTGVAVYDTYQQAGFVEIGGTSVSAQIIASAYGLAGNAQRLFAARSLYEHPHHLYDIPPMGYDEATGKGTPNGIGAF